MNRKRRTIITRINLVFEAFKEKWISLWFIFLIRTMERKRILNPNTMNQLSDPRVVMRKDVIVL